MSSVTATCMNRLLTHVVILSFYFDLQTCSLATSPLAAIVAVGTSAGHIYLIDVSRVDNPRLIYREHFHQGPVKQLVYVY